MSDLGAVDDVSAQRRAKFAAKTEAFIKTVTDPQGRGLSHVLYEENHGAALYGLMTLAETPGSNRAAIFSAIAETSRFMTHLKSDYSYDAREKREKKELIAIVHETIDYLVAQGAEAFDVLSDVLCHTQIYTLDQLKEMATPGNNQAVPLVAAYRKDDGYAYDRDKTKLKLLQQINTPEALMAMVPVGLRSQSAHEAVRVLGKNGEHALDALKVFALEYDGYTSAAAYEAIREIGGDLSSEIQASLREVYVDRLQRTKLMSGAMVARAQEDADTAETPLTLNAGEAGLWKDCTEYHIARYAGFLSEFDPVTGLSVLQDLVKLKNYTAHEEMGDYARRVTSHRKVAFQAVCDISNECVVTGLLEIPLNADEAYELFPILVGSSTLSNSQLVTFLGKYEGLEQKLFSETKADAPGAFDIAIRLADDLPHWLATALESYVHDPQEDKSDRLLSYKRIKQSAHELMNIFSQVPVADAAWSIFAVAVREQNREGNEEVVRRAVDLLKTSTQPAAEYALAQIGLEQGEYLMPVLHALIDRKNAADTPEAIRSVCEAARPLVKRIASPAALYKAMPKMKSETQSELGAAFARIDEAAIIPEAQAGYFTGVFDSVVRNTRERAEQKSVHAALFDSKPQ